MDNDENSAANFVNLNKTLISIGKLFTYLWLELLYYKYGFGFKKNQNNKGTGYANTIHYFIRAIGKQMHNTTTLMAVTGKEKEHMEDLHFLHIEENMILT